MSDHATPNPYQSLMLRALWASRSEQQTAREANYIESMLDVDLHPGGGAHLLDVPCGNGRVALKLAARGHRVTGIDLSESAIQDAQAATHGGGDLRGSVHFSPGDMRDLPWESRFDGAYCLWESFGYFDDAGNRAFLAAAARALKPGAKLLLDTHVLKSALAGLQRREWSETGSGEILVLEERDYDHTTSAITRRWRVIAGGQVETSQLTIRLYSYRELVALLESVGFTHCTGYTWMSIIPFMVGASRLVMVAQRG